jgi:hypothetical protein
VEYTLDPTPWLGADAWLVEASLLEQPIQSSPPWTLSVRTGKVLWQRSTYYWLARYTTPELPEGADLAVEFAEPSADIDLHDIQLILGLQAAGTPEDLRAGHREDGASPFAVQLVFDQDYNLIDAGGNHLDAYREVLALYPGQGLDRVVALLDDAWVQYEFDNEWGLSVVNADDPAAIPSRDEGRPATPGPLGTWRRENGFESTDDSGARMAGTRRFSSTTSEPGG